MAPLKELDATTFHVQRRLRRTPESPSTGAAAGRVYGDPYQGGPPSPGRTHLELVGAPAFPETPRALRLAVPGRSNPSTDPLLSKHTASAADLDYKSLRRGVDTEVKEPKLKASLMSPKVLASPASAARRLRGSSASSPAAGGFNASSARVFGLGASRFEAPDSPVRTLMASMGSATPRRRLETERPCTPNTITPDPVAARAGHRTATSEYYANRIRNESAVWM